MSRPRQQQHDALNCVNLCYGIRCTTILFYYKRIFFLSWVLSVALQLQVLRNLNNGQGNSGEDNLPPSPRNQSIFLKKSHRHQQIEEIVLRFTNHSTSFGAATSTAIIDPQHEYVMKIFSPSKKYFLELGALDREVCILKKT